MSRESCLRGTPYYIEGAELPGDTALRSPVREKLSIVENALRDYQRKVSALLRVCRDVEGQENLDFRTRRWLRGVLEVRVRRHKCISTRLRDAADRLR